MHEVVLAILSELLDGLHQDLRIEVNDGLGFMHLGGDNGDCTIIVRDHSTSCSVQLRDGTTYNRWIVDFEHANPAFPENLVELIRREITP